MRAPRGFALTELLVGIAVGLFIVAAAAFGAASSLDSHRRARLETQLQQDLRSAADLVARELRRAGHWESAANGIWSTDAPTVAANPYATLAAFATCNATQAVAFTDGATACGVLFSYDRAGATASAKQIGFRLRNSAIEMQLGQDNWQAVTDATQLKITGFTLTLHRRLVDRTAWCPAACPASEPQCGPKQELRELELAIEGQAIADAKLKRSLHGSVRLRNDLPTGSCP
jgi:prepilin peptidase dependent protein B